VERAEFESFVEADFLDGGCQSAEIIHQEPCTLQDAWGRKQWCVNNMNNTILGHVVGRGDACVAVDGERWRNYGMLKLHATLLSIEGTITGTESGGNGRVERQSGRLGFLRKAMVE